MAILSFPPPTERIPGPMPRGRMCAHQGCTTLLSSYNQGTTCNTHGGWPKVKMLRHVDDLNDVLAA
jgi:hypothetical protein